MPEIVFKGGTSLSKCYALISRYSEDIDLAVEDPYSFSQSALRTFNRKVLEAIKQTNYIISNEEEFKSGMNMNTYIVNIGEENMFENSIKVETFLALPAYPIEISYAKCYIYDYLLEEGQIDLIERFKIEPIKVTTQTVERTFMDKVFAICDYYETEVFQRNSRHLYDLHKLMPHIKFNNEFFKLMNNMKKVRQAHNARLNIPAVLNYKVEKSLKRIIESDDFKKDYNEITAQLIFDQVTYEECIKTLNKIQKAIANYQAMEM